MNTYHLLASFLSDAGAAGHRVLLVGGCLRDFVLGRVPEDVDLAVGTEIGRFCDWLRERNISFCSEAIAYGTVRVKIGDRYYECTHFRSERNYDGRRPGSVLFSGSVEEDAKRRDFTINSLYWSPKEGVLDPNGGLAHLSSRKLRFVGVPGERIGEDRLRILRMVRFALTLRLNNGWRWAEHNLRYRMGLKCVSRERVYAEWYKIFAPATSLVVGNLGRVPRGFFTPWGVGVRRHSLARLKLLVHNGMLNSLGGDERFLLFSVGVWGLRGGMKFARSLGSSARWEWKYLSQYVRHNRFLDSV